MREFPLFHQKLDRKLCRSISNSISCHFFDQFQIRSFAIGRGIETKKKLFRALEPETSVSTDFDGFLRRIRRRILPEPNFCRLEPKSFQHSLIPGKTSSIKNRKPGEVFAAKAAVLLVPLFLTFRTNLKENGSI